MPQTNGLVERNRRIVDAIGREPKRGITRRLFHSHADRDAFLSRFVNDYNRTRLKRLGYRAPLEAIANLPGPNTCARVSRHRHQGRQVYGRLLRVRADEPASGVSNVVPIAPALFRPRWAIDDLPP